MKKFYLEQVVVSDEQLVVAQLDSGMCVRIEFPKQALIGDGGSEMKPMIKIVPTQQHTFVKKKDKAEGQKKDGPQSMLNTLSLEKQWVISSIVSKYMGEDMFGEKS